MASDDFILAAAPTDPRQRELWLQHAAGFVLFEDARKYALARLPADLDATARAAATKAVDDALYGLMMVIDGVSGSLSDGDRQVALDVRVQLSENGTIVDDVSLREGDGMCMAIHGWREGDFGAAPIVRSQ